MRHMIRPAQALVVAFCLVIVPGVVAAQGAAPELPVPSPKARVEQRVGLTDFAVDYSSPGVKRRPIYGALVPYGKPWRTGANASTKLTASKDFTFGDKKIPAGSYGLYTIPTKTTWTVVLTNQTGQWGDASFDPKNEIARITVKPTPIKMRERLTFLFSATTDDNTRLELEWEKVRVAILLGVDTKAQAAANIDKAVAEAWRPQFTAARYLLENGGDLDRALALSDASIAVKATWWNHWVRAQVLAKKGALGDAVASGEKAQQLGVGDGVYESAFKGDVAKAVASWKAGKK